jgi:hypothetical protein
VHSTKLELLGEGLATCSAKTVAAHWVEELATEASASGSLDVAPGNLVAASRMEGAIHTSAGEPYLGF